MAQVHSFPLKTAKSKKIQAHPGAKPEYSGFQWVCRLCEHDIGVATSTTMQIKSGQRLVKGKLRGGIKADICAFCWQRGKTTFVP